VKKGLLAFIAILFSSSVFADVMPFEFDKSHADITFRISHLGFSSTHGRFNDFEGTLMLDPDDISTGSVEVIIKTSSIETSWPKRDKDLKSERFFNVEQFPEMVFKSTGVELSGDNTGKLMGTLTILDATQPIILDLTVNKIGPHPRSGKLVAGFTATADILRSQWGMDQSIPGIADKVELRLDMEAVAIN